MNSDKERDAVHSMRVSLAGAATFEAYPLDVEDACRRYAEAGYEATPQLREFLETYGELTVTWPFRDREVEVKISVEESLDILPARVRYFNKHLGRSALPIGIAFSTEEAVLLAENGDILFAGDAGMQRVANGFEAAVQAVVTGDWDKTFF